MKFLCCVDNGTGTDRLVQCCDQWIQIRWSFRGIQDQICGGMWSNINGSSMYKRMSSRDYSIHADVESDSDNHNSGNRYSLYLFKFFYCTCTFVVVLSYFAKFWLVSCLEKSFILIVPKDCNLRDWNLTCCMELGLVQLHLSAFMLSACDSDLFPLVIGGILMLQKAT